MAHILVIVYDVRPSGHKFKRWRGEFSCINAKNHRRDIIKFLDQLKETCPPCMKTTAEQLGGQ